MPDRDTVARPGSLTVRPLQPEDAAACEGVARALPAWFGIEEGLRALRHAAESESGFVATAGDGDDRLLGFVTFARRFPETSEITWMATAPDAHRRGVGRALVTAVERHAREAGAHLLLVKTLADLHPSPEYAITRAFYAACGFLRVAVLPEEWDPANPCLLLGKPIPAYSTPGGNPGSSAI